MDEPASPGFELVGIMDQFESVGAALPAYALLPATAMFAVLLLVVIAKTPSRAGRFLIFAIWLRWVLSAYHTFTFQTSPIGLSWNAVATVSICLLGMFALRARRWSDPAILSVAFVFVAIIVSGFVNRLPLQGVDMIVKFAYLTVITLAVVDALDDLGLEALTLRLLWPFAVPFVLQAISIVLGVAKAGESDGSVSFIGGFQHEAAFSTTLAAGLLVVCLSRGLALFPRLVLLICCIVGIWLANYRTAILAMGPLLVVAIVVEASRRFIPQQRLIVTTIVLVFVLLGGVVAIAGSGDRFADLAVIGERGIGIIQRPETIAETDRKLMSGRAYLWSEYLYGYADSTPIQHVFGVGPSSWSTTFKIYAHNTLVSTVYELGAFGAFAYLFLWGSMLAMAFWVSGALRWLLVGGHVSFFVLNMATMPMWQIEGLIYYGILCGVTVWAFKWRDTTLPDDEAASHVHPLSDTDKRYIGA